MAGAEPVHVLTVKGLLGSALGPHPLDELLGRAAEVVVDLPYVNLDAELLPGLDALGDLVAPLGHAGIHGQHLAGVVGYSAPEHVRHHGREVVLGQDLHRAFPAPLSQAEGGVNPDGPELVFLAGLGGAKGGVGFLCGHGDLLQGGAELFPARSSAGPGCMFLGSFQVCPRLRLSECSCHLLEAGESPYRAHLAQGPLAQVRSEVGGEVDQQGGDELGLVDNVPFREHVGDVGPCR